MLSHHRQHPWLRLFQAISVAQKVFSSFFSLFLFTNNFTEKLQTTAGLELGSSESRASTLNTCHHHGPKKVFEQNVSRNRSIGSQRWMQIPTHNFENEILVRRNQTVGQSMYLAQLVERPRFEAIHQQYFTFNCIEKTMKTLGEVSLYGWSPVSLVWNQYLQYIQITTYTLVCLNSVQLNWIPAVQFPYGERSVDKDRKGD